MLNFFHFLRRRLFITCEPCLFFIRARNPETAITFFFVAFKVLFVKLLLLEYKRRTPQQLQPVSAGIFEGSQNKGEDVTPIELPNHVPTSHDGWVNTEIEPLVQESSLAAWSTVKDTKAQPRRRICLPLDVESNKPRLIWDAQYLNSMCKHPSFQMDEVGKVAQCSWKGAQQVT